MFNMFSYCKSLTKIDLSNFNTKNVTSKSGIFWGCKSLKKGFVITKDKNILEELNEIN